MLLFVQPLYPDKVLSITIVHLPEVDLSTEIESTPNAFLCSYFGLFNRILSQELQRRRTGYIKYYFRKPSGPKALSCGLTDHKANDCCSRGPPVTVVANKTH
jgi:hypothetical protein